jgi:hypothetical protein
MFDVERSMFAVPLAVERLLLRRNRHLALTAKSLRKASIFGSAGSISARVRIW